MITLNWIRFNNCTKSNWNFFLVYNQTNPPFSANPTLQIKFGLGELTREMPIPTPNNSIFLNIFV